MPRRLVLDAPGVHRIDADAPVPEPAAGEVRVRVARAGICGSDVEAYRGTRDPAFVRYPVVPGHEWSGTVEAVGAGVDAALLGRPAVGEGFRSCTACARCREGNATLCTAGYRETGFTEPGAFADHLVLPARLLHPLAEGADLRAAALLEPAAVTAAALLAAGPVPGERIAVVGGGTLGLLAVQLLAAASPAELAVVEPRTDRAGLAERCGATALHAPGRAPHAEYDLVVETAGAAASADAAMRLARRGGRLVLAGIPGTAATGLDPAALTWRQLAVRPVFGAPPAAWTRAVALFDAGLLDTAALITHEFPIDAYGEALDLLAGRAPARAPVGKILLHP